MCAHEAGDWHCLDPSISSHHVWHVDGQDSPLWGFVAQREHVLLAQRALPGDCLAVEAPFALGLWVCWVKINYFAALLLRSKAI